MKKILVGLLAISAVAFAAQPVITGDATDGTNYFLSNGTIDIRGVFNAKPDAEPVNYVIFASNDGTWNNAKDTLQLPQFGVEVSVTSGNPASTAGFRTSVADNIYVKRVVGGEVVNLQPSDKVAFEVGAPSVPNDWFTLEDMYNVTFGPMYFFTNEQLKSIANATGLTYDVDVFSIEDANGNGIETKSLVFRKLGKGVLQLTQGVGNDNTCGVSGNKIMDPTTLGKWNDYFTKTPIQGSLKIKAIIG